MSMERFQSAEANLLLQILILGLQSKQYNKALFICHKNQKISSMKKISFLIGILTFSFNRLFAQQWVWDEIYKEQHASPQSEEPSFGYILLGLIILVAIIFVIGLLVNLFKKNKERIIDFFSDFEGCGCLLIILGIVGILTLIGIIK